MKNQYFGDINDYRKYGLIRSILRSSDLNLLVAWMLTPDDGSTDGKFIEYLKDTEKWQNYDKELYEGLTQIINKSDCRKVSLIEETDYLPSANYFSRIVPDGTGKRINWYQDLTTKAINSNIIFLDPDNGVEVKSISFGRKNSSKYVYWSEIEGLWNLGKSLLIYQHFPRKERKKYINEMLSKFSNICSGSFVEAFSTSNVVFFLLLQPNHHQHHTAIVSDVQLNWGKEIQHWEIYNAKA